MQHILAYTNNDQNIAREMARIAVRALYFEVRSYPKPGLVSFVDSGAHDDMNGEKFYRSLFFLRTYFYTIVRQALEGHPFDELKKTALQAEENMLIRTQGVNTHRGALFSLGLFCITTAKMLQKQILFSQQDLQEQIVLDWESILKNHSRNAQSNGNIVIKKFSDKNIYGAKELATAGYPVVFEILPAFIHYFENNTPLNQDPMNNGCLHAYLHFLIYIDDTNILHRKGWMALQNARQKAKEILSLSCLKQRQEAAIALHQYFSKESISPGGVGDLIGVSIFLGQLFSEQIRCHY